MSEGGSFLLVELTAKVQETGEIIDTTDQNIAKEAGIFSENEVYSPRLFIVGSEDIPKPLADALKDAQVGSESQVIVPPEQGYGVRDPSKVRIFPIRRFANVRDLDVDSKVEIDGKIGTVKSITSGRVAVDFNPPLAGRTIAYSVKVTSVVQDDIEKIHSLVKRRLPRVDEAAFKVALEGSTAVVKLPEEAFYLEGLQIAKRALFSEITRNLKDVSAVRFVEEYSKKEEDKKEEPPKAEGKPEAGEKKSPRKEKAGATRGRTKRA